MNEQRLVARKNRRGQGALVAGLDSATQRAIEHLEASRVSDTSTVQTVVMGGSGSGGSVVQVQEPSTGTVVDPALLSRVEALEAAGAPPTAVLAEAAPAGTLVGLVGGQAIIQRSTQVNQPVVSAVTLEAGGIGQTVMIGLPDKTHVLPLAFPELKTLYLGTDGLPTPTAPTSGWLLMVGHSESSNRFNLDPDLCIFRA